MLRLALLLITEEHQSRQSPSSTSPPTTSGLTSATPSSGLPMTTPKLIHANEPDLLGHHSYFDETNDEVTLVQVHRDAALAQRHMQAAVR